MLIGHAAVLGQSFTVRALAAATGHSPEHLGATLDALVRKEILDLEQDPRSPERGQYHFVQGLIREVAYERLARRDRLARHLAAARYFEELDDPELAGIVTTHYLEAHRLSPEGAERDEIAAKARTTLLDAAARSRDLHAYASEQRFLEQALAFAADPADEREILTRLADAAFDGGEGAGRVRPGGGVRASRARGRARRRRPGRNGPGVHDAGEHPRLEQPRQGSPGHPAPGRRRARGPGARRRHGAAGGRAGPRLPDVGPAGRWRCPSSSRRWCARRPPPSSSRSRSCSSAAPGR